MSPTGRIRWRSKRNWLGNEALILQMQWTGTKPEYVNGYISMEDCTEWRDARSEDMSSHSITLVEHR
jgi:hypothetical protein